MYVCISMYKVSQANSHQKSRFQKKEKKEEEENK
jgi:hypothetical protein